MFPNACISVSVNDALSLVFGLSLRKPHYDVDDLLDELLKSFGSSAVIDDIEVARILHLDSMTFVDSDGFRKFNSHI